MEDCSSAASSDHRKYLCFSLIPWLIISPSAETMPSQISAPRMAFTRACLSVSKLLHAVMLFLHLFLFWRGDAWSCTQSVVEAESSACSPQAFSKLTALCSSTAASLHQMPALRNGVKSWKLPEVSVHKHATPPF